uniref:PDZ domain-containing protein n=1 Tax=Parastrongyloides trichosuri TaxID=131310 RepID=A0A0N4Z247_PARTI
MTQRMDVIASDNLNATTDSILSQKSLIRRWLPSINLNILNSPKSLCCRRNNSVFINEVPIKKEDMFDSLEEQLVVDRTIRTDPSVNHRRRTLLIKKCSKDSSFGFTIQSYLLKKDGSDEIEPITYIDSVRRNSPASRAGLVAGDIIIAINGKIVIDYSHDQLKNLITSLTQMRLIVIFENMQKRIELTKRQLELEQQLEIKLKELEQLELEEKNLYLRASEKRFDFSKSQISMSSNGSSCKDSAIGGSVKSGVISNTCTSISSTNSTLSYQKLTVPIVMEENCINLRLSLEEESDESNVKISLKFTTSLLRFHTYETSYGYQRKFSLTSACQLSTGKVDKKQSQGLIQKYEDFLEKNFPKFYVIHKQIVGGCKWCISDLKMYFTLRRALNLNKKKIEDFNRKELECFIQTSSNLGKIITLAIVAPLPFGIYPIALSIIFLPRLALTHHFWGNKKFKEFLALNIASINRAHLGKLFSTVTLNKSCHPPLKYSEITYDNVVLPPLNNLPLDKRYHLHRFHQVSLFNGIRKLDERSELIHCLDNELRRTMNNNLDKMNEQELISQLYMRKITFNKEDDIESLRKQLREWLKYSNNFYRKDNKSLILYAPILTQKLIKN